MKANLQVVVNAIRKNGYEQAFGTFTQRDSFGRVTGACALGQGALNLKVEPTALQDELNNFYNYDTDTGLGGQIVEWNDSDRLSLAEIADRIEAEWAEYLDQLVSV